jgi:hypothetical protein
VPACLNGGAGGVPVAKKDAASKRLAEAIAQHQGAKAIRALVPKLNWKDKKMRERIADEALTLSGSPFDAPLRTAFQAFDLDPEDPYSWRILLMVLAATHFEPRPKGRKPEWDDHRRLLLKTDKARARRSYKQHDWPGEPTGDDIAAWLQYFIPDRYGSIDTGTLRKYLTNPPHGRGRKKPPK